MAEWTRTRLISEAPEDRAARDAARKAKSQQSRAETQQKAQQARQDREREREEREKEKEQDREDRAREREQRQQERPEPEQKGPPEQGGEGPPKPKKILKPIPSPERAEVKDRNYGMKKKADKPEKTSFDRKDIIKRMFKARVDRLEHLKSVARTSLDLALGLTKQYQAGAGYGLSSSYHRYGWGKAT